MRSTHDTRRKIALVTSGSMTTASPGLRRRQDCCVAKTHDRIGSSTDRGQFN
jgi:hypothetical protein